MRKLLIFLALCAAPLCAHAQFAIGGAFTAQGVSMTTNGTACPANTSSTSCVTTSGSDTIDWVYGPTLSAQYEFGKVVHFGPDFRFSQLNGSDGIATRTEDFGPRLGVSLPGLGKLYGEVLIGFVQVRPGTGRNYTGHADNAYIIGLDHTVLPHIDWRIVEYAYSRILTIDNATAVNSRNQISSGILVRF